MTDETRKPENRFDIVQIQSMTQEEDLPATLRTKDPFQWRANLKATIAGRLALSIWVLIGLITLSHLISVAFLWIFPPKWLDSTQNAVEQLERGAKSIDETAKTLYTFLGTLATAITGYYFSQSSDQEFDEDEE